MLCELQCNKDLLGVNQMFTYHLHPLVIMTETDDLIHLVHTQRIASNYVQFWHLFMPLVTDQDISVESFLICFVLWAILPEFL